MLAETEPKKKAEKAITLKIFCNVFISFSCILADYTLEEEADKN